MKITMFGCGYVGLVSGTCFAECGHQVTCVDIDAAKVSNLQQGIVPIYEPGLEEMLKKNHQAGRLTFTTDAAQPVREAEIIFIAVGTPPARRGSGHADMSYVYGVARSLAPHLQGYTVIANKSTAPVGSTHAIARVISSANPKADFDVASNPEFLREGAALYDFMNPDRLVFGADSPKAVEVLKQVYRPVGPAEIPCVVANPETAELIKYASNAFLATKISFINEMANLCECVGANVHEVATGMGLDRRIGKDFLQAGPGFGGSCFPKDTVALARMAQERGAPCRLVETAIEVNHAQKVRMVRKIRQALGGSEVGKTIAVLGLTFKPGTDDMREAPSLTIVPTLMEHGAKVRVHDPVAMEEAKRLMPEVDCFPDPYQACEGADAVCLLTAWEDYRRLDLAKLRQRVREAHVIDCQHLFARATVVAAGFTYTGVGV